MKKKSIGLVLMLFGILGTAQETEVLSRLTLQNDLSLSRNEELVEIPESHVEELRDEVFKIVDAEAGQELVYQWLNNGDLLVQADFKPREQKTITFLAASPQDFPPQVYGRFVPERYGDFTWENENIAFRMYGSPLEKVPSQNAWGLDVWAKRTPKMIINQWYKNGHYHTDHGTGLDFFKVGKSLGAGDIIPLLEGKMQYTGNYTSYKILESGPLRFSFELYYPAAKIAGQSVVTIKKISLDADAQLNKI